MLQRADTFNNRSPLIITILAWTTHLALIWVYRFVPAMDYPEWLLQANVIAHYFGQSHDYSKWYTLVPSAIPNGGFVLPTAMLAAIIPIEIAGKIVLSIYIIWFPLALRSYFRRLGNDSAPWEIGILLLFNISFVNGNIAFLIGVCLLLALLEHPALSTGMKMRTLLLTTSATIVLFLTHGLCAFLYFIYVLLRLTKTNIDRRFLTQLLIQVFVLLAMSVAYMFTKPAAQMVEQFAWGFDARYRLSTLAKSFIGGYPFPPYSFSVGQTMANLLMFAFVGILAFNSIKHARTRRTSSLAIFVLLSALVAPKYVAGFGEPTQRLAFVGLLLLVGFFSVSGSLSKLFGRCLAVLLIVVTAVRVQDYSSASMSLERRFEFIRGSIPPGTPVLSMNDDLGTSSFILLIPKGMNFTFQSNYLLLTGGFNPLSFRTGYVLPRDNFLLRIDSLSRAGEGKGFEALHGADIPPHVSWIVLDAVSDWDDRTILRLQPEFEIYDRGEPIEGIRTDILRRRQHAARSSS